MRRLLYLTALLGLCGCYSEPDVAGLGGPYYDGGYYYDQPRTVNLYEGYLYSRPYYYEPGFYPRAYPYYPYYGGYARRPWFHGGHDWHDGHDYDGHPGGFIGPRERGPVAAPPGPRLGPSVPHGVGGGRR